MAEDLVDRLLERTGLYVGTDRDPRGSDRAPQAARIVVTALPGGSGVTFDYEAISENSKRPMPHSEHAVLARTPDGLVLHSASNHAPVLVALRETEAGMFVAADGAAPFPMGIRIEVPSPGRLRYSWCYGEPGGEIEVRNIGDVVHVG